MENQKIENVVGLITEDNLELTKQRLEIIVERISNSVDAGLIDPLHLVAKLDFLSKAAAAAKKSILEDAILELDKHGKEATIYSATMKTTEAGVKYDFSNSDIWNDQQAVVEAALISRKAIEAQLKTIKTSVEQANTETGVVEMLNPPIKSSTTTIKITYPKQ